MCSGTSGQNALTDLYEFNPIDNDYPLILASASPQRRRLLAQVQLPFEVVVSHVDEAETGDSPAGMCQRLAQEKAVQVHSLRNGSWILGADTIVVIGHRVLGKPADKDGAREMLRRLSGVEHAVITGFCIVNPSGEAVRSQSVATVVRFKALDNGVIDDYIQTGEPFGKAGAYAIQGIGAFMVESISGSYTNVVGLPVCAVVEALIQVGALRHFPLNARSGVRGQESEVGGQESGVSPARNQEPETRNPQPEDPKYP